MKNNLNLDYYYGIEAEQFSFYRLPRLLIKDERFKELSNDAKLLYGLMLDRMSLSMKNGWVDEENRVYIIYSIEDVMEDLGYSKPTCIKIIKELDIENGIGLIERKRRRLGKTDIIYVKDFTNLEVKPESKLECTQDEDIYKEEKRLSFKKEVSFVSESKETEPIKVKNIYFNMENNFTYEGKKTELQEVKYLNPNYNNNNYTDIIYTNPINQSIQREDIQDTQADDMMDGIDDTSVYIELIKQNIEYEDFMTHNEWQDKALYQELFNIICEVVCVKRKTVKVGGEDYPYELVKSKFLKLDSTHLQYVIGCMQNTNTKISNIKAYLITTLYNAQNTINHYYQQEVRYDMYGGGWHEKGII